LKYGAEVERIFVKESVSAKFSFENQIVVADKVFDKMCDTVSSQGVLAVVNQRRLSSNTELTGDCLVLDGLQDPGNVGTLVRTAAACGFNDIFAVNCVDLYSPKVLRAAMSAHFCLNLRQTESLDEVFLLLKNCDFQIVAADMAGKNVFDIRFPAKTALVLGNEGNGLSDLSKSRSDLIVALPMQNNFESLNVAVAGSVIMYQIFGKNR